MPYRGQLAPWAHLGILTLPQLLDGRIQQGAGLLLSATLRDRVPGSPQQQRNDANKEHEGQCGTKSMVSSLALSSVLSCWLRDSWDL